MAESIGSNYFNDYNNIFSKSIENFSDNFIKTSLKIEREIYIPLRSINEAVDNGFVQIQKEANQMFSDLEESRIKKGKIRFK